MNQNGPFYTTLPRVYTVVDRNGFNAGSLASENLFLEAAKCRLIKKPQEPFNIYIKAPGCELAVANGGGFTANAATTYRPWLDLSGLNIEHYGAALGMIMPSGSPTSGFYYNVNATFYLQFKNVI